jgi:hypothetical protein
MKDAPLLIINQIENETIFSFYLQVKMIKDFYNGFEMNFNFNVGQFLFLTKIIGYKYNFFCKWEDQFLFNINSVFKIKKLVGFRAKVQWVHPLYKNLWF